MKKEIIYLLGMPRAGNTLLASLINQNKNIIMTGNSLVPDLLHETWRLKYNISFQNFPDNETLDIYLKKVIPIYYESFDSKFIIDRGPWGTPGNLMLLQKYVPGKLKFIVLTRTLVECIGSFIEIMKINKKNIQEKVEELLSRKHILGMNIWSIQNAIKESSLDKNIEFLFITYDELIKDPNKIIEKICIFIGAKHHPVDFKNMKQLNIKGVEYNDKIFEENYKKNLHVIRTDKITKIKKDYSKILTKKIYDKFKDAFIIK
jgi:hypothetical protein